MSRQREAKLREAKILKILTNVPQSFNDIFNKLNCAAATARVSLWKMRADGLIDYIDGEGLNGQACCMWYKLEEVKDMAPVVVEATLYQAVMSKRWDGNIFV